KTLKYLPGTTMVLSRPCRRNGTTVSLVRSEWIQATLRIRQISFYSIRHYISCTLCLRIGLGRILCGNPMNLRGTTFTAFVGNKQKDRNCDLVTRCRGYVSQHCQLVAPDPTRSVRKPNTSTYRYLATPRLYA